MQTVQSHATIESKPAPEKPAFALFRVNGAKLLLAAAIFHVLITCSIYAVGRLAIAPTLFDTNGILSASDNASYLLNIQDSMTEFHEQGISAWLADASFIHIKLYALCFLAFSWLFGANIVSLEPLNLLCYLAILTLIFRLARDIFDRRVGLIAATIIALWPSFLLHTTQIFRDPLFIAAFLLVLLIVNNWLQKNYSLWQSLRAIALGIIAVFVLLMVRENMWELSIGVIVIGAFCLLLRQIKERRVSFANLIVASVILVFAFSLPHDFKRGHVGDYWFANLMKGNILPAQGNTSEVVEQAGDDLQQDNAITAPKETLDAEEKNRRLNEMIAARESAEKAQVDRTSFWVIIPWRLWVIRYRIARVYGYTGSNIDPDVAFRNFGDVIRYTPRALSIGLFAPFPNMWLTSGSMGKGARLLSGFETLLMYVMEALAAFTVWRSRKRLEVWYLLAVVFVGVTLQAMVISNMGALFRMRYVFWMLLIILGVQGITTLFASRKTASTPGKANA